MFPKVPFINYVVGKRGVAPTVVDYGTDYGLPPPPFPKFSFVKLVGKFSFVKLERKFSFVKLPRGNFFGRTCGVSTSIISKAKQITHFRFAVSSFQKPAWAWGLFCKCSWEIFVL